MEGKEMKTILLIICMLCAALITTGQNTNLKTSKEAQKIEYGRSFQKVKYPDSAYWNKTIAISGFSPNEMLTLSRRKITIVLDYFKVTDTIWIQAGKRKVGIPAYRFLEYFKDEPSLNGSIFWNGGSNIKGL
jgi:hypothetical protein